MLTQQEQYEQYMWQQKEDKPVNKCVNCGNPATRKCKFSYKFSVCNLPICDLCGHNEKHDQMSGKPQTGQMGSGKGMQELLQGSSMNQQLMQEMLAQEQKKSEVEAKIKAMTQQMQQFLQNQGIGQQGQGQGQGGNEDEDMSMHWNTPQEQMDVVKEFFSPEGYELDPCYNPYSVNKGTKFNWTCVNPDGSWTGEDSLRKFWYAKSAFVNHPYGRTVIKAYKPGTTILEDRKYSSKDWLEKCAAEFLEGHLHECISLTPVDTSTEHWQEAIFGTASAVCFVKKRIKFKSNPLVQGTAKLTKIETMEGDFFAQEATIYQVKSNDSPKQANAYVYWGYRQDRFAEIFGKLGHVDKIRIYVEEKPYVAHLQGDADLIPLEPVLDEEIPF